MTATRTDVPLLDLDVLRSIEWPEGYDSREILHLFGHSAWPQRSKVGTAYRRWLCEQHPLNFALTYLLPFFADQVTRRISFAEMHMDMFRDLARWVGPGPTRRVMVAGREGGKALALDTPVLTVDRGWTEHGELKTGDRVFDETGAPCSVVAVSPVWEGRPTYEITFSDGEMITADANHEWRVRDLKRQATLVQTTAEIADRWLLSDRRGWREVRYSIPMAGPVQYPSALLPITPYVLGVWLGDGNSADGRVTSGALDHDEMAALLRTEGEIPVSHERPNGSFMITLGKPRPNLCRREHEMLPHATRPNVTAPCRPCTTEWVRLHDHGELSSRSAGSNLPLITRLRRAELLDNKHIPAAYFTASIEQRLALLQGLMDTDGTVAQRGRCEFTGTNERLCRDVLDLVRTLGIKARMAGGRASIGGVDKGPKWRVTFHSDLPVFRLTRKLARQTARPVLTRASTRRIVDVRPVTSRPTSCVQVDSPSHLYLVGRSLIPTHNSTVYYLAGPLFNGAFGHHQMIAAFSYTDKQASGNHLRRLRGVIEGKSVCSELLLSDFPDLAPASRGGGRVVHRNGVTIACAGLGSNVVGLNADTERPGIILGDDLLPADRTNPDNVAAIKSAILTSIMPLGRRAHIRLFGTVFARKDLMDDVVRLAEERPATSPDRGRWLTGQGFEPVYYRPNWPQRWPVEEMLAERAADPHTFALRLAPHLLDQAEAEAYWTTETWVRNPMFPTVERIISVDHAVSTGRKADHTAIAVLGANSAPIGTPTRRVGVEHVEQGRMGIPQIRQRVWDLYRQIPRHKPTVLLWERNQGGEALAREIYPLPDGMKLVTWHAGAVKAQRVIKLHKQCVSGQVVMVGEHPDFEGQAESWDPRSTKDDMLDAVGSGARRLLEGKAEM
jgi:hypothetical protein